jgi:hypothetical protein
MRVYAKLFRLAYFDSSVRKVGQASVLLPPPRTKEQRNIKANRIIFPGGHPGFEDTDQ